MIPMFSIFLLNQPTVIFIRLCKFMLVSESYYSDPVPRTIQTTVALGGSWCLIRDRPCYFPCSDSMGAMASQITGDSIIWSTVGPGAEQRKHQSPRHWALGGKFTGDRWIPAQKASVAEHISIWRRHHVSGVSIIWSIFGVTVSIDSVNHINSTMKALVIPTGNIAKVCDPKPNIHISWCARDFRKSAMWLINVLWNRPCTTKGTSRLESSAQGPWENRHHSKQGIQIDARWCRINRVISKLQVNIAENDFVVIYFVEVLISAHN